MPEISSNLYRFPTSPAVRAELVRQQKEKLAVKTQAKELDKNKISRSTGILMISTAIFYDLTILAISLLDFIPVIGNIISSITGFFIGLLAGLTFFTWFIIHKIKLLTPKRATAMIGGFISSIIPFISLLPGWTLAVTITIATTRSKIFKSALAGRSN